jgi:sugar transferase (PEP-CTERM system associated)
MREKIAFLCFVDGLFSIIALFTASALVMTPGTHFLKPTDVLLFTSIVLFSSYFLELYTRNKIYVLGGLKDILAVSALNLVISFFLLSTVLFFYPSEGLGKRMLLLSLPSFALLQLIGHYSYKTILHASAMTQRVMILGTGDLSRKMERIMLFKQSQYIFAGYYDTAIKNGTEYATSTQALCADLAEYAKDKNIHKIVVAMEERRGAFPLHELLTCKFEGVEIVDAPSFYEEIMGKMLLENITPGWFIFSDGFRLSSTRKLIKRVVDIFCSIVGLILSVPLFLLIALCIKCDSKGPVFYKQLRVGEGEKNFLLYKFRTMRADAENGTGAVWAQENDKRITRIGSILRNLRLDELPQFFNVFKGDMSFIGPRPERPEFVETLKQTIPYYMNRHFVKPGITGWAQVKYRYGASMEDTVEKLRYDLYYIKNLSPLLDISIFFDTIKVVLFGKGAR